MRKILLTIRVNDWWNHLLPPVIGFYFLGLLVSKSEAGILDIATLALSLAALSAPVAAFGFFINDWMDIELDAKAGKTNMAASLKPPMRIVVLLLILLPLTFLLWLYPFHEFIKWLILLEMTLLVIYSCPPLRFKRYVAFSILLDALYSSAIPFMVAILMSVGSLDRKATVLTLLFGVAKGIRNILYHLMQDKSSDQKVGHETLAHKLSLNALLRYQEIIWLVEVLVLLAISRMASPVMLSVIIVVSAFMLMKRRYYLQKMEDIDMGRRI